MTITVQVEGECGGLYKGTRLLLCWYDELSQSWEEDDYEQERVTAISGYQLTAMSAPSEQYMRPEYRAIAVQPDRYESGNPNEYPNRNKLA